jgi:hypothetical protein
MTLPHRVSDAPKISRANNDRAQNSLRRRDQSRVRVVDVCHDPPRVRSADGRPPLQGHGVAQQRLAEAADFPQRHLIPRVLGI